MIKREKPRSRDRKRKKEETHREEKLSLVVGDASERRKKKALRLRER